MLQYAHVEKACIKFLLFTVGSKNLVLVVLLLYISFSSVESNASLWLPTCLSPPSTFKNPFLVNHAGSSCASLRAERDSGA